MMKKMVELKRKIEEFKREKNTTEPGSSDYENRKGTSYNREYGQQNMDIERKVIVFYSSGFIENNRFRDCSDWFITPN
ncbi:hypothetical protein DPMN_014034 [Dreissena polymorpha]|uniref:Uncharacterized protein n=1 Tax=Dreissena polymorpha TaxID=45954 RepID=A0A9D4S4V1_DREPO|nr:hypothetical protein DPMN_014034 [Dreissena polymorpha]